MLCDVSLPDIEGPALYDEVVRRDPELARRFVFVTGGAFNDSTREFLRRYQGPRLDKPFPISRARTPARLASAAQRLRSTLCPGTGVVPTNTTASK